jgi:hypothetical protein
MYTLVLFIFMLIMMATLFQFTRRMFQLWHSLIYAIIYAMNIYSAEWYFLRLITAHAPIFHRTLFSAINSESSDSPRARQVVSQEPLNSFLSLKVMSSFQLNGAILSIAGTILVRLPDCGQLDSNPEEPLKQPLTHSSPPVIR